MSPSVSAVTPASHGDASPSFLERLNGPWHARALWLFLAIVLAHWAEHLAQAYQVYALH